MDDLIQILIFAGSFLVFIISAIRKQKKKSLTGLNAVEDSIASVFGINANYDNKFVERDTNIPMDSGIEVDKMSKIKVTNNIQIIDNKKEVSEYKDDIEDDDSSFDLRKAVIYSEILNRKTF